MRPPVPPSQPFPFLALSLSRTHVPLKSIPTYRFDAGVASERSIFPLAKIEYDDNYSGFAEEGLIQIVGMRRKQAQVWIPRRVTALALHPPTLEALDTFLDDTEVAWKSSALAETGINQNFITFKAPVPRQRVTMELGGPPQVVQASALIAAGLRAAIAETLGLQDFLDFQKAHPDKIKLVEEQP